MRKDRMQLWLFRRARTRLHLDQIRPHDLALQLSYLKASESMGNHDSEIVDAGSVD
jgi:hypothetical protein